MPEIVQVVSLCITTSVFIRLFRIQEEKFKILDPIFSSVMEIRPAFFTIISNYQLKSSLKVDRTQMVAF